MSSSTAKKEREAYKQRERLKNYDKGTGQFKADGESLRSHQQIKKSYTKLDMIHYVIILSILISLVSFSVFLILTYIPITKPFVMKVIDTVLVQ